MWASGLLTLANYGFKCGAAATIAESPDRIPFVGNCFSRSFLGCLSDLL